MTLLPPSRYFPPPETAMPEGLLAVGGQLAPDWLLDAYQHGIFPWPVDDGRLAWWSPDPRAVLEFDDFYISRRLARTLAGGKFEVTSDRAFDRVIEGCASAQDRAHTTWITPELKAAFLRMHELGYAHSVETWHAGELAGGVYGLAIRGLFAAESMFYRVTGASNVALAHLVRHLSRRGFALLDLQQLTEHTEWMGGSEIPRSAYLARLAEALGQPVEFGEVKTTRSWRATGREV